MGMPATMRVDITSSYNNKGSKNAETSLQKLGRQANRVANVLGVALAAGAVKAVDSASNLEEAINATNVVFGDAADKLVAFGETASRTVGLSNTEFQSLATKTGGLLANLGYSTDEAADSTIALAERAADMASVFNTDVGTALEAIQAGLRGETEQLLNFNVALNASKVEAKAMELGLYDGVGAISDHAKALATEALILEQTDVVAGDFANTSDSLAGQQRILAADMENLSAQIGTALLPIATQLITVFADLANWANQNQTAVMILLGAMAAFVVVVKTVTFITKNYTAIMKIVHTFTKVWTVVQGILNAVLLANPIVLIIAGIVALIAIIGTLIYINRDKLIPIFRKVWDWVKTVANVVKNALAGAFDWVSSRVQVVIDKIKAFIDRVRDAANYVKDKLSWLPGINSSAAGASVSFTSQAAVTAASRAGAVRTGDAVTIQIQAGIGDPAAIARTVRRALAIDARRTGWATP